MTAHSLGGDYWRLWTAAVFSRFGDALRTPALALLAAALTRDPRAIAVVMAAGQLPPLLFGLLGGVYADRWDRRRAMAVVDGLRSAVVGAFAVLVATGRAGIAALAACAFLLGTLGTLFDAASFAMLPALVPADRLTAANGRLQAGTAVAGGFLGAPVAGLLFAVATALPFALDAVSFAVAALLVLTLRPVLHSVPAPGPPPGPPPLRQSVWRATGDGLRWIVRDATLRRITLLTATTNLAISGLIAVMVLYALDVLGLPEAGYGLFMAGAGLGGLAGALGAGRLAARVGTLPALRGVLATQTLALTAFALARHPVTGGVALAVFAAGTALWNILCAAYSQRNVPAHLLGRVGSAQRMAGLLTAPVGALLAGFAAAMYGVAPIGWAVGGVFALITAASWRALRPPAAESPAPLQTSIPANTAGNGTAGQR